MFEILKDLIALYIIIGAVLSVGWLVVGVIRHAVQYTSLRQLDLLWVAVFMLMVVFLWFPMACLTANELYHRWCAGDYRATKPEALPQHDVPVYDSDRTIDEHEQGPGI